MKRPSRSLPALTVLALGALLGTGIAPASAGGWHHPPHSPQPVPSAGEITTLVEGLASPLSFAVGRRGPTFDVAQSVPGGSLVRRTPDGATRVLDTGPEGFSPGAVSRAGGRTFYTLNAGQETNDPEQNVTLLKSVDRNGTVQTLADISAYEYSVNPDAVNTYGFENLDPSCPASVFGRPTTYSGLKDSNPYATLPVRGGVLVADAAMNALIKVDRRGTISTVAVLPPVPVVITPELAQGYGLPECAVGLTYRVEPVPTDIERGPDGNLYVGSLPGGVPGVSANGSVFRVDPRTGASELVATGFSGPVGLAVDRRGDIFVAELFANRISVIPAGSDTAQLFAEVPEPAGVELRGSTLYASANVLTPGADGSPQGRIIGIDVDGGRGGHHGGSYSLQEDDALEDAPLGD